MDAAYMSGVADRQQFLQAHLPVALDMLQRMVEINSYTANVQGVNRLGEVTAEYFKPLGFEPEFVPSKLAKYGKHLVMRRAGNSPRKIALISHLDTVFPPEEEERNDFHWLVEGDRIFGPGTHDIKGGTVMMWLVLKALQTHYPAAFESITWQLLWNSSEEQFSPDFGDVCRSRFDAHTLAALVFEAEGRLGDERLLVLARKGRGTWRATIEGRGAHAGGKHHQGANAIVQAGLVTQKIAALTDYSKGLTFNAGTINGGTVLNRVPHSAIIEGEFRAFAPEVFEEAKKKLLGLSGAGEVCSKSDGYACVVKVEVLSQSRPWPRNAGTDRLFQFWSEAGQRLGIPIGHEERGGLSDGNMIWDAAPTLDGLGPWGDNDHCSEHSDDGSKVPEYVLASSFVPKALVNLEAIASLVESNSRA
jgi:glutamate carboxypeptidase